MKRDMDLVRQILLFYEDDSAEGLPPGDARLVLGHLIIMIQSGLIEGSVNDSVIEDPMVFVTRLTWAGHDFLALARNETVWNQAKTAVRKHLGDVSLDVLKALLTQGAMTILGSG